MHECRKKSRAAASTSPAHFFSFFFSFTCFASLKRRFFFRTIAAATLLVGPKKRDRRTPTFPSVREFDNFSRPTRSMGTQGFPCVRLELCYGNQASKKKKRGSIGKRGARSITPTILSFCRCPFGYDDMASQARSKKKSRSAQRRPAESDRRPRVSTTRVFMWRDTPYAWQAISPATRQSASRWARVLGAKKKKKRLGHIGPREKRRWTPPGTKEHAKRDRPRSPFLLSPLFLPYKA